MRSRRDQRTIPFFGDRGQLIAEVCDKFCRILLEPRARAADVTNLGAAHGGRDRFADVWAAMRTALAKANEVGVALPEYRVLVTPTRRDQGLEVARP